MRAEFKVALQAIDAAAAGPTYSDPFPASQVMQCSVFVLASGSPVGTVKLQFSNDNCNYQGGRVPDNWVDIPSATVAVSAAGNVCIPKTEVAYGSIRVAYTKTSGTGNITAFYFSQAV